MILRYINVFAFALLWLPVSALAHGDLHLQIEDATKLIEKEPKKAELYLKRGELHRAHQDWDAAQADYDRAGALDRNMAVLDLVRGKLFLEANWPISSVVALDRFLAVYTNHVDALVTRARALVKLERRLDAVNDYSRAIASAAQPQPEMFLERALALVNEGEAYVEQALKGLDEGMTRLGPLVVLQQNAIDIEIKQKHFDAALARVERATAQAPRKETWLERRGDILQQAGRSKEATEAYQAALNALATLPPSRRQVPAMIDMEQRLRLAVQPATRGSP